MPNTLLANRLFPTASLDEIGVISIPSNLFGEYIKPGSFKYEYNGTSNGIITDDGNGGSAFTNTIITANALPAEKVVTDPSTCLGTSVNITLVGSVSGVNYQLRADNDDSLVGTAVAGTGSDIKFPVNP